MAELRKGGAQGVEVCTLLRDATLQRIRVHGRKQTIKTSDTKIENYERCGKGERKAHAEIRLIIGTSVAFSRLFYCR
jgi:hypothetical protein